MTDTVTTTDMHSISWSDLFAGAALFLSLVSIVIHIWQNNKNRQNSINDIFWFREVIYPLTIKPVIQALLEIKNLLPQEATSEYADENVEQTNAKIQNKLMHIRLNYTSLSIDLLAISPIKSKNYKEEINDALEDLEESITIYCAANNQPITNPNDYCHNKEWIDNVFAEKTKKIIDILKQLQSKT